MLYEKEKENCLAPLTAVPMFKGEKQMSRCCCQTIGFRKPAVFNHKQVATHQCSNGEKLTSYHRRRRRSAPHNMPSKTRPCLLAPPHTCHRTCLFPLGRIEVDLRRSCTPSSLCQSACTNHRPERTTCTAPTLLGPAGTLQNSTEEGDCLTPAIC